MTHVLRYKMYIYLSHMSYAIYYMKHVLCYIFMIPIYWVSVQHITTAYQVNNNVIFIKVIVSNSFDVC